MHAVAADPRVRRADIGLFFLLAAGVVAAILIAFLRRGALTPPLDVLTVGSGLSLLAIGVFSLLGVGQLLRGTRVAAPVALVILAVDLLVVVALRVEVAVETGSQSDEYLSPSTSPPR